MCDFSSIIIGPFQVHFRSILCHSALLATYFLIENVYLTSAFLLFLVWLLFAKTQKLFRYFQHETMNHYRRKSFASLQEKAFLATKIATGNASKIAFKDALNESRYWSFCKADWFAFSEQNGIKLKFIQQQNTFKKGKKFQLTFISFCLFFDWSHLESVLSFDLLIEKGVKWIKIVLKMAILGIFQLEKKGRIVTSLKKNQLTVKKSTDNSSPCIMPWRYIFLTTLHCVNCFASLQ